MINKKFIQSLNTFDLYKNLILSDKCNGKNIIIETKDNNYFMTSNISDLSKDVLSNIERITIFKNKKDYEFVSCQ